MQSREDQLALARDALLLTLGHPGQLEPSKEAQIERDCWIPVTVVCGFLGAGKTTILCDLLRETEQEILAIVNDIASVNIDGKIIREQNAETLELENGCACCVLGSDLSEHLTSIRYRENPPDAIVIEASGLSDPYGIVQTVTNQHGFELDGVVTVVDALTLEQRESDPITQGLLWRQLDSAHLVAVTKSALGVDCQDIRAHLAQLAPGRPVVFTDEIPDSGSSFLFGASLLGARLPVDQKTHDYNEFRSEVVTLKRPVPEASFFELCDAIPDSVYRIKGNVRLSWDNLRGNPERHYEVQAVGRYWRVREMREHILASELVVIGASADKEFSNFLRDLQAVGCGSEGQPAIPDHL